MIDEDVMAHEIVNTHKCDSVDHCADCPFGARCEGANGEGILSDKILTIAKEIIRSVL